MARTLVSILALLLAACSSTLATQAGAPTATPQAARPPSADVYRFSIGSLEAAALRDGSIELPNDAKEVGLGQTPQAVAALLSAAGLATDVIRLDIEPLLVRSGAQTWLFDTGAGDASFARGGGLPTSLRAAGVEASQVSDIFITHGHLDHVGGLLTPGGELAFPNAAIRREGARLRLPLPLPRPGPYPQAGRELRLDRYTVTTMPTGPSFFITSTPTPLFS